MAHALFDLGGVLVSFDHSRAISQVAEYCGVDADELHRIVFAGGLEEAYDTGRIGTLDFWRELRTRAGFRSDPSVLAHAWSAIFAPKWDVFAVLDGWWRRGVAIGLVSNTNPAHWAVIANMLPLEERLRWRFLSFEMGVRKPAPAYYARVASAVGEPPSQGIFIDDRSENLEGARAAGWQVIGFESAEALRRDGERWLGLASGGHDPY